MTLEIVESSQFRRDSKRVIRQGKDYDELVDIVEMLVVREPLAEKHRDHDLKGNWVGHRECHIRPDWLLIYRVDEEEGELLLARTGSHSELF